MCNVNNTIIINKAYSILDRETPLRSDCGRMCNSKCCKGSDDDGMLLFPGEEELFRSREDFTVFYDERYNSYCVSCHGVCDRNIRPLSCRIFPYMIYLNDDLKPAIAPDIRAIEFCPVLKSEIKLDKKFLRALRICASYLCKYPEYSAFISEITAKLTDFNSL